MEVYMLLTDTFSVLRDAWIPLEVAGRSGKRVSYVDLLCGEADAPDLFYPRDDLRCFAKILLSALTQAFFTPKQPTELKQRIKEPLSREIVEATLAPHLDDFRLVGCFLQSGVDFQKVERPETERMFLDLSDQSSLLFKQPQLPQHLCPSCAIAALYGVQSFAPSGGVGLKQGICGDPPLITLVRVDGLRASVWANVLSLEEQGLLVYPTDAATPWRQKATEKTRTEIALVEGLFWQPRAISLEKTSLGSCHVCGEEGERLQVRGFQKKSGVEKVGWYCHPYAPYKAVLKKDNPKEELYFQSLDPEKPTWTGLADLLSKSQGQSKGEARAAPVVEQWRERLQKSQIVLEVFQYKFVKNMKCDALFTERFSLMAQIKGRDLISDLRGLIQYAEKTLEYLQGALLKANDNRKKGKEGFWLPDAVASFWQQSEPLFWSAVAQLQRDEEKEDALFSSKDFKQDLDNIAKKIFDEHTALASTQNAKQKIIAVARGSLAKNLAIRRKKEGTHEPRVN
jgi:CRISPR type I-E-associated protein CasA/Cse1